MVRGSVWKDQAEGEDKAVTSWLGDRAREYADSAAGQFSEVKQTDAIGQGLAAVALALLDVATAIRESAERD